VGNAKVATILKLKGWLFEYKKHLQSYRAQSSKQRVIFSFKEIAFLRQQMV